MSKRELTEVAKELIAAKKRIENPENWGQDSYWYEGRRCALGALYNITNMTTCISDGTPIQHAAHLALNAAGFQLGLGGIVCVNDDKDHAAVMLVFDHAIATEIQKANAS